MENFIERVPAKRIEQKTNYINNLKNLADWIARYLKLDLKDERFSLFGNDFFCGIELKKLLDSGQLIKYQPSLKVFVDSDNNKYWPLSEFQEYEFNVCFESDIETEAGSDAFLSLDLFFKSNNKCEFIVRLLNYNGQQEQKILCNIMKPLGFYPEFDINEKSYSETITWNNADDLILKLFDGLTDIPNVMV